MSATQVRQTPNFQQAMLVAVGRMALELAMEADRPAVPSRAGESFDDLLVAIGSARDRNAFARLFEHFAPRVKSYVRRLGADEALAEDLAQDVLLTVWHRAFQYDPAKATASTWIFTIARNRRIDALRRERRPEIDPDDPALVPDQEPSADQQVAMSQFSGRLRQAVANLPAEQAALLRLAYYEDKSHSHMAQELDLPVGTVKSRLRLAMTKLRAMLGDQE